MSWMADVVYGLKLEEGRGMTFNRDSLTMNTQTGLKTGTTSSFYIDKVIPLPLQIRQAFFKAFNGIAEGYLQPGEQQYILDMSDIPTGSTIRNNDYLTDSDNVRYDIVNTEEYKNEIMLLTVKVIK